MNRTMKKISSLLLVLALTFMMCMPVLAAGTTTIYVSNPAIGVGGSTDVSVEASASGTITIKYTASLLSLIKCDADGYTSDGNTITFKGTKGVLTFEGIGEGTASIIVSSTASSGSSTTISIGGNAPAVEEPEISEETEGEDYYEEEAAETFVPEVSGRGTLNDAGGFDIDGVSYVVSERYADEEIPTGFSKVVVGIAGHTYNELTNGAITLLYLKPADNTQGSGVFYQYDEENGVVNKFAYIAGSNDYVILTTGSIYCEAFVDTVLSTSTGDYAVFTIPGSQFDYFFGVNSQGVEAWYMYDVAYNTISRADELALTMVYVEQPKTEVEATDSDEEEEQGYSVLDNYVKKLGKYRKIIAALVVLCVILVFVIINMLLRHRADDEEEVEVFKENVKVSKRRDRIAREQASEAAPKTIGAPVRRSRRASEDDEDDDDFEASRILTSHKPTKSNGDVIDFNDL